MNVGRIFSDWKSVLLFLLATTIFLCSVCRGELTAEDFDAGSVSAKDFLTLADKWDDESTYGVVFHDGMTDRQLWYAHGKVDALDKCAAELRALVKKHQQIEAKTNAEADLFADAKNGDWEVAKKDEQLVSQQAKPASSDADDPWYFGGKSGLDELPPLPQQKFNTSQRSATGPGQAPPIVPNQVSPYTPRPEDTNGNPILIPTQKQVQVPQYRTMSCGNGYGQTYQTYRTVPVRRGLFGARRGGFRLFGRFRGGC